MNDSTINEFEAWEHDIVNRVQPKKYEITGSCLQDFDFGPELVTVVGGPPNSAKSPLVLEAGIDILRLQESARLCICNTEMPVSQQLNRQLARLSGICLDDICNRSAAAYCDRLTSSLDTLRDLKQRILFAKAGTILEVAAQAKEDGATILIVDHLQGMARRESVTDVKIAIAHVMDTLRECALSGMAVLVVSEISRPRRANGGADYNVGAGLGSFKDSSEIEYGADNCYILSHSEGIYTLSQKKTRYGVLRDIKLTFEGDVQRFSAYEVPQHAKA